MISKLNVTALFLLLPATALSQNARDVERYELERKITAAEARQNFTETLKKIEQAQQNSATPTDCPTIDGKRRVCITTISDKNLYLGDFVPFLSNHFANVPSSDQMTGGLAEVGWVPVNRVADGQRALSVLEERLRSNQRIDCDSNTGECRETIEAIPEKKGERVLAVCNVAWVGSFVGAGRRCEAVAIITPEGNWVRAIVGYTPGRFITPLEDPVTDVQFHLQGDAFLPSAVAALGAAQEALSSKPMSFNTELLPKSNPIRVIGVTGLRLSPVLPGTWWEKVTIRIDLDREEGQSRYIIFSASFSLQFNKQNTDRREDFRAPTEAQFNRYKEVFLESIKQTLPKLCPKTFWKDSTTLVCQS